MPRRKLLVAGGVGLIGRAVIEHFEAREQLEIVGLSRRRPDFDTRATFVSVDRRDRQACARELAPHRDTTHLVYAAVSEKPDLIRGWRDADQIEVNAAMFRNLFEVIESPRLEHVTLLQGTKAYGAHVLGRMQRVPAREREPRVEHANFYFEQEDYLREKQRARDWSFSILRPQIVLGVAVGGALNVVATIGAYAAIQRDLGLPFGHPGHEEALTECTDVRLLARAVEWSTSTPECDGQAFNITNGDVAVWRDLWPRLAEVLEVPLGDVAPMRLQDEMPKHAALWHHLAEREGLRCLDLDALIGLSWQFADVTWAARAATLRPALVSTIKARQYGFDACVDTEDSLAELLQRMREERYLP